MTLPFYISYVALWLVVAFQTLLLLGLVREHATHSESWPPINPLPIDGDLTGEPLPEFSAFDTSGMRFDRSSIVGQRTALLFVSPNCEACSASLEEMQALRTKTDGRVIVVCRAADEECQELGARYGFDSSVLVDADGAVSRQFGVNGTPLAVLVGEDGRIETYGSPMRGGDLEQLVTSTAPSP